MIETVAFPASCLRRYDAMARVEPLRRVTVTRGGVAALRALAVDPRFDSCSLALHEPGQVRRLLDRSERAELQRIAFRLPSTTPDWADLVARRPQALMRVSERLRQCPLWRNVARPARGEYVDHLRAAALRHRPSRSGPFWLRDHLEAVFGDRLRRVGTWAVYVGDQLLRDRHHPPHAIVVVLLKPHQARYEALYELREFPFFVPNLSV
jgi:hypothetical protein